MSEAHRASETSADTDDATRAPEQKPDPADVLRRANLLLAQLFKIDEAIQLFDDAGVDPPQDWLLFQAEKAWSRRHLSRWEGDWAIPLFTRAGAVERLNRIGEHLALDYPCDQMLDAFYGAGNFERVREFGWNLLRAGSDVGLHAFRLLKIQPPKELLEEYARAVLAKTGIPYTMIRELKAAGIRLPRTLLLEPQTAIAARSIQFIPIKWRN